MRGPWKCVLEWVRGESQCACYVTATEWKYSAGNSTSGDWLYDIWRSRVENTLLTPQVPHLFWFLLYLIRFLFFIFGCLVQHSLPSLYPLDQPWTLHLVSGAFGSTVHHQIYCEITILRYKTLAVVFTACADNDSFLYSYLLDDHWYARVIFLSWNPHHLTLLLLPLSQRHTKAVLKSEVTGYSFTHTLQCSLRQQSLLWKCWDLVISIGVLKSQFR